MKKLLLLGGSRYLMPVISEAHSLGIYVITCDYLPNNYAHKYSDEYWNISIIDKDAVLKKATKEGIDGILSFGTDPGVVTCAYVAEKMGLPGSPYKSVLILQNKDLFRKFLRDHQFNAPLSQGYSYSQKDLALQDIKRFCLPVIVKPVDSAGSKGVSRVDTLNEVSSAIDYALDHSICGRFIIEEFIQQDGFASDSDCFSINSQLVFSSFDCQYFDEVADNPYTPAAFTWPSTMPAMAQRELRDELERLIQLLHMGTSIYNVETRVGTDGKAYIMECSPRGGGNRLSEMLKIITGQDLISNNIRGALGMPLLPMKKPEYQGVWAEYILHSYDEGKFKEVKLDSEFEKNFVKQKNIWVKRGDEVHVFSGANQTIGTLVMQFESHARCEEVLVNIRNYVKVCVE